MTALGAHARAAGVLARTLELPWTRRPADSNARIEHGVLGEWPTAIARPRTPPPWPTVLFANGATPDGRTHPGVRRLAASLAQAGYAAFVPDLPGVAAGELSLGARDAAAECALGLAEDPRTRGGRVGLIGVSVGGTLALLAASSPELRRRVSVVVAIAPFTDLERVMMLATTGAYPGFEGAETYAVPSSLPVGLARSLVAAMKQAPDVRRLRAALDRLDPTAPDPLRPLRESPCESLGPAAASTQELLLNRDPSRFAELYAALPDDLRQVVRSLSPLRSAASLAAPVEIATAPRDKYFPVAESLALQREAANVRITVSSALEHATPRMSLRDVGALVQLHGFFARSLDAVSAGGPRSRTGPRR
jgi:pimeloyl-ACP methyl ester carboxylesterase